MNLGRTLPIIVLVFLANATLPAAQDSAAQTTAKQAATVSSDAREVLVRNQWITITRADFQAELARRVPEKDRAELVAIPDRVFSLLNNLLVRKTLAAQARAKGLDRAPLPVPGDDDADAVLAERMHAALEAAAAGDFDRRIDDFTARAREIYLVDRAKYVIPEAVDVSHILFIVGKHGQEEARALASEARAGLVAGAEFGALARELSEDPTAKGNAGHLGWVTRADVDEGFGSSAFRLSSTGELSEPARSRSGYHIIRLDGRRAAKPLSFAEAKDSILGQLKAQYLGDQRLTSINAIQTDPALEINQAAVDSLVVQQDRSVARKFQDGGAGGPPSPAPSSGLPVPSPAPK